MIEIVAVVLAVTGITALARGRGANTVLTGVITVAGYVALEFGLNFLLPKSENRPLIAMVAAWTWIALLFILIRFAVGAGMPKPDSKWNCSKCRYLNDASSVICEACQQPWKSPDATA